MHLFRIRATSPEQPKTGGLVLFTGLDQLQVIHVGNDGRETDISANVEALSVEVSAGKALSATIKVAGVELDFAVAKDSVTQTVVASRNDAAHQMRSIGYELGLKPDASPKDVAAAVRRLIAKTQ